MSERGIFGLKPDLRLEWRSQGGQYETQKPDHSASLGDSVTPSTRIGFSVHTGRNAAVCRYNEAIARYLRTFSSTALLFMIILPVWSRSRLWRWGRLFFSLWGPPPNLAWFLEFLTL